MVTGTGDTGASTIKISATSYTGNLTIEGPKNDLLDMEVLAGTGNDIINTGVSNTASTLTGGSGVDTFNIQGESAAAEILDLGAGADILTVTSGAGGVNALVTNSFTASAASTQNNTDAGDVNSQLEPQVSLSTCLRQVDHSEYCSHTLVQI